MDQAGAFSISSSPCCSKSTSSSFGMGKTEIISLDDVAAMLNQEKELLMVFNAFCNNIEDEGCAKGQ